MDEVRRQVPLRHVRPPQLQHALFSRRGPGEGPSQRRSARTQYHSLHAALRGHIVAGCTAHQHRVAQGHIEIRRGGVFLF